MNVKTGVFRTSVYFGGELMALHCSEIGTATNFEITVFTDQLQIVSEERFFSFPCLVPYHRTTMSIPYDFC